LSVLALQAKDIWPAPATAERFAGAVGAVVSGFTVIVIDGVTASGLTPFVAVTVNVAGPAAVGVPERTPVVAFKLNPAGRAPEDTRNVGAGLPDAANVYE
jgi:hypothetical protein